MKLAGLRALLERNEHDAALGAVQRIRFAMLEGRLKRAEAERDDARRRLFDYQLDENAELQRLRLEVRKLQAANHALQQQMLVWAKIGFGGAARGSEPYNPPHPPSGSLPAAGGTLNNVRNSFPKGKPRPRLSPAALAIFRREPPDPAAYDRTITDEDAA